ncbi:MAG: tRNA ((37)-N6)-dimethylallyltransferase MiaA [Verrucomicrobiota bacterium]|jgi:tRNA dimethylallyltransferase
MNRTASNLPDTAFFILGPTAVGKSELAVQLAEAVGGEIVGADAYQIYSRLDILSAKPDKAMLARVPHHLVGEIPLAQPFDVATFRSMALARIREIADRGNVPIICGGAGLYVRALTHGIAEGLPQADSALRARLENEPLSTLVGRLRELDPAATVDENNRRRVVRALEVCMLTGRPFSSFRDEWNDAPPVRGVIVSRPREDLQRRIELRTEAMFAAGVVAEVANSGPIGPTAEQMLGLREIRAHIAGDLSLQACKAAITLATRQYAKRQMTWFRRERGYVWMDLVSEADPLRRLKLMATVIS